MVITSKIREGPIQKHRKIVYHTKVGFVGKMIKNFLERSNKALFGPIQERFTHKHNKISLEIIFLEPD